MSASTFVNKYSPTYVQDQVFCAEDASDLADNNAYLWQVWASSHNLNPGGLGSNGPDGLHLPESTLANQLLAVGQPAVVEAEGSVLYVGAFGAGNWALEDGINVTVGNQAPDVIGGGLITAAGGGGVTTTSAYHFSPGGFPNAANSGDVPTEAVWFVMSTTRTVTNAKFMAYMAAINAAFTWAAKSDGCRFGFTIQ